MAVAFVFPGRAARTWAWGASPRTFKCAHDVFDEVDAALGQKLSHLMWEGRRRR